jgi:hypothetical protein
VLVAWFSLTTSESTCLSHSFESLPLPSEPLWVSTHMCTCKYMHPVELDPFSIQGKAWVRAEEQRVKVSRRFSGSEEGWGWGCPLHSGSSPAVLEEPFGRRRGELRPQWPVLRPALWGLPSVPSTLLNKTFPSCLNLMTCPDIKLFTVASCSPNSPWSEKSWSKAPFPPLHQ